MSDLAPQFYDAFCDVNNCDSSQLYCTWHVDKALRKEIKEKVKSTEIQQEVYKRVRIVLEESNKIVFEDRLKTLETHLSQANSTRSFSEYFKTYWVTYKERWGYCYRVGYGINTNMYVEAFHRVFKYQYLKGKYNKRVDKCLLALLKYDRDKSFDRLIKLTKGKSTNKLRIIHQRHQKSLELSFKCITKIDETHWNYQTSESLYNIQYHECQEENCKLKCFNCDVCNHQFTCTCNDFLLNKTICKHIHLLKRSFNDDEKEIIVQEDSFGANNDIVDEIITPPDINNFVNKMVNDKVKNKDFENMKEQAIELMNSIMSDLQKCDENDMNAISHLIKTQKAVKNTFESMIEYKAVPTINLTLQGNCNRKIDTQRNFYSTKKRKKNRNIRLTKPTIEDKRSFDDVATWFSDTKTINTGVYK